MKYQIIRFNQDQNHFECKDSEGNTHRIDLFVSASHKGFGHIKSLSYDNWLKKMHSFAGRYVEIERLHPYEEIANGVELLSNVESLFPEEGKK